MYVYNDPILKTRRRELRKKQTEAEGLLWDQLRGKKLQGRKFFRQYSVGPYILDFFCPSARLAIELDGEHHANDEIRAYDEERSGYLQSCDIRALRFWNHEISQNLNSALERIMEALNQHPLLT